MSKALFSLVKNMFSRRFLYLTLLAIFIGLSSVTFSAYSKIVEQIQENGSASVTSPAEKQNVISENNSAKTGCCGGEALAEGEFYTLLGTYYGLKDNQTSILMFNNKGPAPLVVNPVVFNLSGQRLDLPPLVIPASSYQEFDARDLLAGHLPQFEEGSFQVTHQGAKLQLGVQIKILKLDKGLIFDEQLVQTSRFVSSRLENVWWLPSSQSKTKFIISNTTDSPVTATVMVDGTAPKQQQPTTIELNPHQTKVLDILRDLVGKQQGGTIHKEGGISITHSGTPGAVLARMFVSKENTGFSSVANFIDPQATRSSKWNGSGYRIGKVGNDELTPIVVARNIGNQPTNVSGRISYTNDAGEVVFINVPSIRIDANKIKTIDVERAVRQSNVPANVSHTGFEFEYSTPNGSVVMAALSVSRNDNHVFQVPLFDPERMASSAGGYPWKADGDYTTMLYIKNETDQPQKYTAVLSYEGGNYAVGVKDIKPHQLVAIDFRSLRDSQTPDAKGQIIPLNVERGEIAWSSHGKTNKALSGRSHQSSVSEGVSSTYDCRNCCPNNDIYSETAIPGIIATELFDIQYFQAEMQTENCYGSIVGTFPVDVYGWESSSISIATIESGGTATAQSLGEAFFSVPLTNYIWRNESGNGSTLECFQEQIPTSSNGGMEVRPPEVTFSEIGSIEKGGSKNITATVRNRGNYQITLFLRTSQNQSTTGVTFDNGSTSKVLANNNGDHTVTIKGITSSTQLNDYKIEARYDNNFFLAGQKLFTVSSVSFGEESSCSGFDNNYVLVPKGGTNTVKAYIEPSGASGNFKLEVSTTPGNQVSVSPATVISSGTVITVTGGNTVGNFKINVSANQQNSTVISELNVYVRNRIDKTLIFYAVTEDGTPDTPPPSSNVPTATGLQTYLNNTWGKQANVYFTVTKGTDFEVNYDLNGDNKIDSQAPGSEPLAILNMQNDATKDFNIYFLGLGVKTLSNGTTPAAFSNTSNKASFIGPTYNGTRDYITAHEIGHLLGASGRLSDITFLMYESDLSTSPCKIGKLEWDIINP